jgi:cell filamentation protein
MKYSGDADDPYIDKQTGILRNLLGISTQEELDRQESNFSFLRSAQLHEQSIDGNFDFVHLRDIHRVLFSDIYEWAGEIRQVEIQKGKTIFAHCAVLENAANHVFKILESENYLTALSATQFADRAGYYLGEINVLHPFRDGNGRAQREFIAQLARKNNFSLSWSDVSRDQMISASTQAYNGNHKVMAELILKSIT